MFKNILIPLDSSALAEIVLPHAQTLAQASNARIDLLHVMEQSVGGHQPDKVDPFEWQIMKAQAETYLEEVRGRLQDAGLEANAYLEEGSAAEGVIEFAHSHANDLILLSSHGKSGISGWNVSSVVQKIILRAHISIMILRAYQPVAASYEAARYHRILVPLDGSQRAECSIPIATGLARLQGAELLLAHVVRPPEMPRRTPPSQEDQDLSNQVVERNRQEAEAYLEDLSKRLDLNASTKLEVNPDVYGALHNLSERENVDLVVVSAHGYTGGMQWPYGNVVVSFVAYGSSPLLIVQDLPRESILPTRAEQAAREQGVQRS